LVNRRDLMKEIITEIINEWDPIDLFPFAPQDEYKKEIDFNKCFSVIWNG